MVANINAGRIIFNPSIYLGNLGFPLFIRKKNKISLTSDAEILLQYVRQLLQAEEVVNQAIDELKGLERGFVRLGCFNSVCTKWIPELVKAFGELYPGIEIEIFQGTYNDIAKEVQVWILEK